MNLYDLNGDKITMLIDGKDIEMKHPTCYGKEYNKLLVSKCGKVWSLRYKKFIGQTNIVSGYTYYRLWTSKDWWGDGSGTYHKNCDNTEQRAILGHKMVMDTWAPLYDNPPEGLVWEEWKIVRDLPTVYDHISKTVVIDHIDDNPTNNHLDNLRRVTSWDNQRTRKAKGI